MESIRIESAPVYASLDHSRRAENTGKQQDAASRPLEVVIREFVDMSSGIDAIKAILQNYYDTMSRIIENMVMTLDERHVLEERREKNKKLHEAAKEQRLNEQEIKLELDKLLSNEDKWMLEDAISLPDTVFVNSMLHQRRLQSLC